MAKHGKPKKSLRRIRSSQRVPKAPRRVRVRREIENWVVSHFSNEFHLPPGRVDQNSALKHWGYGDEKALGSLAGQFNQAARSRPNWHEAHVTPPELVSAVQGKTIGGLVDFLSDKLDEATEASINPPETAPTQTTLRAQITDLVIRFVKSVVGDGEIPLTEKFPLIFGNASYMNMLVEFFGQEAPGWHVDPHKVSLFGTQMAATLKDDSVDQVVGFIYDQTIHAA